MNSCLAKTKDIIIFIEPFIIHMKDFCLTMLKILIFERFTAQFNQLRNNFEIRNSR